MYNVEEFLPHAFEQLISARINDISDEECHAIRSVVRHSAQSQGTSRCAPSGHCIGSPTYSACRNLHKAKEMGGLEI
ncbi:hypothetical protein BDR04DRAFT_1092159 [Suillus decipiens]|nr:hypothetical protein BDR04DRAFT_1092159 [Suillus decipiens]